MNDIPETVMNKQCAGCAMRPGTEANQSATTRLTLHLCLCIMAGVPFQCHDGGAGHLCRGFHDAFAAKLKRGDYASLPPWKDKLARRCLDLLDEYVSAAAAGEPFDEEGAMRRITDELQSEQHSDDEVIYGG